MIRHLEATPKVPLAAEKRRMIKALIFDFDGTLVDFVESDIASLKYIYRLTGMNHGEDVFIERAISNIIHFHELVDKGEVDPKTMHRYRLFNTFNELGLQWDEFYVDRYKAKLLHETKPYPGADNLLRSLLTKGKLGIITNAYDPEMQLKRIEASGLFDFFDEILIAGEEVYSKPDPQAFHLVSKRLDLEPAECIFIGDSPEFDIQGANSAGMITILIHRSGKQVRHKPDYQVYSIEELGILLGKLIA